ncbi:uncharacterized protein LOC111604054 [Drosophila hydei]|uniref:Uncharacterized protein LOC111604054 n=1 Tax=Drosophila hydei TaxID=7224 RepID=A0A6J2SS87_DROHY|nr:uncharacterized protein LOC111604054 [Drosophila hydei]
MPPLQGRRQLITRLARVHRVNVNIGSYINRNATNTKITRTTTHKIRTRDRFRFRSSTEQRQRSRAVGHFQFHLRGAGLAAVDVATVVAASLTVNSTCQAEEQHITRNRLAGSQYKTVAVAIDRQQAAMEQAAPWLRAPVCGSGNIAC